MDYVYIESLLDGMGDIPEGSILSRTIYDDEQVRAVAFSFAPGEELSEHTSSYAAVLQFIQGEADVTVGGDAVSARSGTFIHMAPNMPHSIHARTPVVMLLLMFKAA
jgi:quercetin dioxygenase-like cupin family protein